MRHAEYHPKVPGEVRRIVADYERISSDLADGFWSELTQEISYATEFPERHHFDASGRRRSNLKRFPYHFLFRVFDYRIRITVLRHHSRSPEFGTRRK